MSHFISYQLSVISYQKSIIIRRRLCLLYAHAVQTFDNGYLCPLSKETYYSVKRDLLQCYLCLLYAHAVQTFDNGYLCPLSIETYYRVKRDLLQCQKRPTTVSKETYYSVKRDLLQCQKRPTTVLPLSSALWQQHLLTLLLVLLPGLAILPLSPIEYVL